MILDIKKHHFDKALKAADNEMLSDCCLITQAIREQYPELGEDSFTVFDTYGLYVANNDGIKLYLGSVCTSLAEKFDKIWLTKNYKGVTEEMIEEQKQNLLNLLPLRVNTPLQPKPEYDENDNNDN